MLKLIKYLAYTVATLYVAACAYMYFQQRSLVFNPGTEDVALSVGEVAGAINVTLTTSDGEMLKAWWVAPQDGRPVYLYLHGNAGNLLGSKSKPHERADRFGGLTQAGAGLLALSWRGYGGSSGAPSEAGFVIDAEAALAWLRAEVPDANIILFGESLGSGMAVQLAAREEFSALVLDSPYTSIVDVGAGRYPWLPVRLLSKDHFESL
ncbi:MAG: alpha/beta fold hydrolase, partial [Pseudomonadota bacterium]